MHGTGIYKSQDLPPINLVYDPDSPWGINIGPFTVW